jgi:tRNA pseudouridine13 synthase
MKLKSAPGDFRVDEVLDYEHDPHGRYYVHLLEKRKLDTQRALTLVAKLANVDRGAIAYAGLKDRQGVTSQWISIEGRSLDYEGDGLRIRCHGRSERPIDSRMSAGNRFTIIVRDLGRYELDTFERRLPEVERDGFANYFDDQRFGCVRHGQGFVMRDILFGRYDRALQRLVAQPSPVAIAGGDVQLKRALKQVWGDWEECARIARGPVWRRLFEHLLMHPDDHRGALGLLPTRTKLIHAFAFQSLVWNRAVSAWLRAGLPRQQQLPIETIAGTFASWRALDEDRRHVARAETPMFGSMDDIEDFERHGDPEFVDATYAVLDDLGLAPESFTAHRVPGMALRVEERRVLLRPRGLSIKGPARDEANKGRSKIGLRFALPRGAYATMVVKHLFGGIGRG